MAKLDDFPELKEVFEKLTNEQTALRAQSQSLHDRYNELQALVAPQQDEMRDIQGQIQAIERPRMGEIANQLSAIARAIGGRSTSDRIVAEVIEEDKKDKDK